MDPNMGRHHMVQLLDALMYRCPLELRGIVMREVPEAYNAYLGSEVVHVTRTSDGRRLTPPDEEQAKVESLQEALDVAAVAAADPTEDSADLRERLDGLIGAASDFIPGGWAAPETPHDEVST